MLVDQAIQHRMIDGDVPADAREMGWGLLPGLPAVQKKIAGTVGKWSSAVMVSR